MSLVVLPPLLHAAGEELSWRELRRVWRPVAVLSVGLVLVSAVAVAAVAATTVGLEVSLAFLLGAVLASTDPVAVSALGRRLSLPPRLQTLVQAESLFNDATSLILFRGAAGFVVAGGALSPGHVAVEFLLLAVGGAGVGAVVAAGVAMVRRRTEDPVSETVVSLITPYLAYVAAEALRTSGVTAVVVASVILGVLATLMVVRVAWVFPLAMFRHWRHIGTAQSVWQVPAIVSWAGARGVVPLAAALSIPLADAAGRPLPHRDLLLVLATAVIVISLVVQGFTLAPLVRRTDLAVPPAHVADEYAGARLQVAQVGLAYVDEMDVLEAVPVVVLERVRRSLQTRVELAQEDDADPAGIRQTYRQVRRDVVAAQSRELARMYAAGTVGEATRRRIQRQLDLEDARFSDDR